MFSLTEAYRLLRPPPSPLLSMAYLWLPRGPCLAALTMALMVLSPPVALVRDTRQHFLLQLKAECHYPNGRERVWSMTRFIYNQEEFARFDSDVGKFLATTELGQPIADDLNTQKDVLDNYRASVDRCRNDYEFIEICLLKLKKKPQVTVHPSKTQRPQHHNLLVCSVSGFYPSEIKVTWFRNGQEERAGVVSTGLIPNGDWSYQTLVMLETVPQSGDVYTCCVEHASLPSPVAVEWRAQSGSAQSKMLSGVCSFVLGLLFLGAGLFIYFRNLQERPSGL